MYYIVLRCCYDVMSVVAEIASCNLHRMSQDAIAGLPLADVPNHHCFIVCSAELIPHASIAAVAGLGRHLLCEDHLLHVPNAPPVELERVEKLSVNAQWVRPLPEDHLTVRLQGTFIQGQGIVGNLADDSLVVHGNADSRFCR